VIQTLRKIVQKVNSAENLADALDAITSGGRKLIKTDACSVWIADTQEKTLLFKATDGLETNLIDSLELGFDEGVVGLVAQRAELINLPKAIEHPRYKYIKALNEQKLHSFLGAPILHAGNLLGVIVAQNNEERQFSEEDESALVTLSAQLAGVLAFAARERVVKKEAVDKSEQRIVKGIPGASGIGIGGAVVLRSSHDLSSIAKRYVDDIPSEIEAFNSAVEELKAEFVAFSQELEGQLNKEELALFDVYCGMLDDQAIGGEINRRISGGLAAESAIAQVFQEHIRVFKDMSDEYFRERAADVRDLGLRLLTKLKPKSSFEHDLPDNCIIVASNLVASHLGQLNRDKIAAMVSVKGSSTSHVAILARAMGIPTVMGCEELPYKELSGKELIVDGYRGHVTLNAKPEIKSYYQRLFDEAQQLTNELQRYNSLRSETKDGYRLPLLANTGLATDAIQAQQVGAEGVGLYRTEVPFLLKESFPSEGEQTRIYRNQLETFAPLPVTMRTLDIGGDKALSYFPIEEDNPFLGWRGIRISLDHPEIFLTQVRAMILASEGLSNLKIMLPMVCSIQEFDRAKSLIVQAFKELVDEGYDIKEPDVGVMIEVPAAAYIAEDLAKKAAFLSVGSNDLVQYLLAVDRNNERVSALYDNFHPAVIKALQEISDAARRARKPISLCGEMANDPASAVLLHAMGFTTLSLNSYSLPRVKAVLRSVEYAEMRNILNEVRGMNHGPSVRSYVEQRLRQLGVDPLLLSSYDS